MSLTEALEDYLSACEGHGHLYRRFNPTPEHVWEDVCEYLEKDKSELPAELLEWYAWTDPPETPHNHVPWLNGNAFGLQVPEVDYRLMWDEIVGVPDDDPDREIVEILNIGTATLVVSTREVDGGSVWARESHEGLSGRVWDSISDMVVSMAEFTRSPGSLELVPGYDRFAISLPFQSTGILPEQFLRCSKIDY